MDDIIKIEHLNKSYGEVKAVSDLSFKVKRGELFAFLGVNGAGKSTTISMISGILKKDSGNIIIDGVNTDEDFTKISRSIGVVFQSSALDKSLTIKENISHRASLYGIYGKEFEKRFDYLATALDFKEFINRPLSKLSGGQRRRADIARALIHNPEILILDEPTTGLDPQTRTILWDFITKRRKQDNLTVFLTTHYMEEATDADYVIILDGGKIVAEGTPLQLKNTYTGDFITLYNASEKEAKSLNRPYEIVSGAYRFKVKNTAEATNLIVSYPEIFKDYEVTKGKMDDVFLTVTGKNLLRGEDK